MSQEFMIVNEDGEDHLVLCDNCDYAANAEAGTFAKGEESQATEKPVERIATPGRRTIAEVAEFVGVDNCQTLKAVFYTSSGGELVFAVIRGDLKINESKLSNVLGGADLQPAPQELVEAAGLVPGYASPVGVQDVRVIADDSIKTGNNFVTGANQEGYHLKNVNYPRDFEADVLADIALATEGASCDRCGGRLSVARGIEVGHLFALGTKYSKAMEATFLDQNGRAKPLIMGCYGIGVSRIISAVIEQYHQDGKIQWPLTLAPFSVEVIVLKGQEGGKPEEIGEETYNLLKDKGIEVLLDDRDQSPGEKFNDADLIGAPLRIIVGPRGLAEGAVEIEDIEGNQSKIDISGGPEEVVQTVTEDLNEIN